MSASNEAERRRPAVAEPQPSRAELVRLALGGHGLLPADLTDEERLSVAWTLKDECYAAWTSDPRRAIETARALQGLCDRTPASHVRDEIGAVAAWTEGIACASRGQMGEAIAAFDDAARRFRELGQPRRAAQTQVPKIMALSMLGRNDDAALCAEATQREFVAHGDMLSAAKVSLNLGSMHLRQDAPAQAAGHYREAAVLFARVGDIEHSVMADIGLADALTSQGDFDEANRIYARARMRAGTHGFPVLAAIVDESVALLDLVRARYGDALAGLERARRAYESLAMPQHLAIAEKQLADAYLELRLLPEALDLFDHALSKFETLEMRSEQAWTLAQQGRAHALLGHFADAREKLLRASERFAEQGNRSGEGAVALARAELDTANDDFEGSCLLASEAQRRFAEAGLADRALRAQVVLARALLGVGKIAEAGDLYAEALGRAQEQQLLAIQVQCLTGQGLIAQARGDAETAAAAFAAAVELFEDLRRALPGDDLRNAFLADNLVPYRELMRIALADHARLQTADSAADVLVRMERVRARSLAERLSSPSETTSEPAVHALRRRLNWLYRRVRRAQEAAEPTAGTIVELRRIERELLERARRERLASAPSTSDDARRADVDVDAIRASLAERDALIEYGVVDDELFACVVRTSGVSVRRSVARWTDVVDAVRVARFQMETLRHGSAGVEPHLETLLRRARAAFTKLHARLWAPVAQDLIGCGRAIVVPHAQLAALPFCALHDGERFVGERIDLAMAPSARIAVHELVRAAVQPRAALVIGESSRLPHAADEARFVARMFERSAVFTGDDATVDALRLHAEHADVVHIACHAQFRADNPMFSALHLHDGALTAEWVEQLRMRAGIVVLSACETGLSEHGQGDEMMGLVRAFLLAGAARVVATLWPVDDEVTLQFMSVFYSALREMESPAAALRMAQSEVMRRHPHPFYWAGFTIHGGW